MAYTLLPLLSKNHVNGDTTLYEIALPQWHFKPGQYVLLKNPHSKTPDEEHPFSIASSPENSTLEFCIKTCGDWTKELGNINPGDMLEVSDPQGDCLWDENIQNVVFLIGGIGISPVMAMLRSIAKQQSKPLSVVLLYGNRTPQTIVYKNELEKLKQALPMLRIVHIFSELSLPPDSKSYIGFITRDIIEQSVTLANKPTFFVIGPPIFLTKMTKILISLRVLKKNIRCEDLSLKVTS